MLLITLFTLGLPPKVTKCKQIKGNIYLCNEKKYVQLKCKAYSNIVGCMSYETK